MTACESPAPPDPAGSPPASDAAEPAAAADEPGAAAAAEGKDLKASLPTAAEPSPAEGAKPALAEGAEPATARVAEPAPAEGANPPPAEGAKPATAEGANPPPAEGATPAAAGGATPAPAEGATPPPAGGAEPAPAEGATPAAAGDATPAPAEGATPAPAGGAEPAAAGGPNAAPAPAGAAGAPQEEAVAEGKDVEVVGTSMNGSTGVALEYLEAKGRWKVRFASGVAKNFKAENLRVAKPLASGGKAAKKRPRVEGDGGRVQAEAREPAQSRGAVQVQVGSSVSDLLDRIRRDSGLQSSFEAEQPLQREAATPPPAEAAAAEEPAAKRPKGTKRPAAAAAAPQAAGEAASEVAPAPQGVNLAGRAFAEKDDLIRHVKEMQKRLEEKGGDGVLEPEDRFLLFHMALQHPRTSEKIRAPVNAIRYGVHHSFPQNKCFILVFSDGTEEPVSWTRCVRELFAPGAAARAMNAGVAEAGPPKKKQRTASPDLARGVQSTPERSRAETGLQLIREVAAKQEHPHAARWEYPLADETRRCFAGFLKCPLEPEVLKGFYERAASGTTWGQPVDPRSGEPIPRKTAWMVSPGCTCTYRYGGVDVAPQEFPAWMVEVMQAYMPMCGISSREEWPNSCNLNLYEDGAMSVGWHSDDEKLFQGRFTDVRIISVSLGQARTFELRELGIEDGADSRTKYRMRLGDGDLCTMEGLAQKHYQHRVPKEEASGPRINLTWRWVRCHRAGCPAKAEDGNSKKA